MTEYNPSKIIKDGNTYNFRDTTKIPLAGSNQISGSLIPATTDAYDLGGSSYQWNNAYIKSLTINGVACGDILTHNASEFVDVSSNQTIGGIKTFSNEQPFIFNKEYNDATDVWLSIHSYLDKNSTRLGFYSIGDFSGYRGFRWFVRGQSTNSAETDIFGFGRKINETSYMYINATLETDLIPTDNNSKSLGTSTNKWKSFNGVNPGALSLPSMTYISLDTTNFDVTATTIGTFTPTADGWAILSMSQKNKHFGIWIISGAYRATFHSVYNNGDYFVFTLMPVRANVAMTIYCSADDIDSTRTINWLRLFPCQGNV